MLEKKPIHVLVAEDDFLISRDIQRMLKNLNFEVTGIAPNGEKAIELAEKEKPDVILMDIKMPKMNGIVAAKKITATNPIPIVILSAHETGELVQEALEAGIGAYLTKPPRIEEIERAIYVAMARHNDLIKTRELVRKISEDEKELRELNATKDKFMSIIAHDLRGPIGALMAFSEQIHLDFEDINTDQLKSYLKNFHRTSKGIYELLENLLYWARVQTGKVKSKFTEFNLETEVDSVMNLLATNISNKQQTMVKDYMCSGYVYLDKNIIHTVLRNLMSNAIKFTPKGGKITIRIRPGLQQCQIEVSDTGIGLAEEDVNKLFSIDKSFSYKGTEGEEGTGLGLVLCKDLVEMMNGTISVKSELGKGTSFLLNFDHTKEPE
jgi:two-component system sensor histidine kinase/response regulator